MRLSRWCWRCISTIFVLASLCWVALCQVVLEVEEEEVVDVVVVDDKDTPLALHFHGTQWKNTIAYAYLGDWASKTTTSRFTSATTSHGVEVLQEEFGGTPTASLFGRADGYVLYCPPAAGSTCTSRGRCGNDADNPVEVNSVGYHKVSGAWIGHYLYCSDGTVTYCTADGQTCTLMFNGNSLSSITYGRLSVEYSGPDPASQTTAALVLATGSSAKRCTVSGGDGDSANCVTIGGNYPAIIRNVGYNYAANGAIDSYMLSTESHVLHCWPNDQYCDTVTTGGSWYATSVVRNQDGTTYGYFLGGSALELYVLDEATSYAWGADMPGVYGLAGYFITTTTTTVTTMTTTVTSITTSTTTATSTTASSTTTSSTTTSSTTMSSTTTSSTTTFSTTSTTTTSTTITLTTSSTTTSTSSTTSTSTSTSTSTTTSTATSTSTSTSSTSSTSTSTSTSSSTSTSTSTTTITSTSSSSTTTSTSSTTMSSTTTSTTSSTSTTTTSTSVTVTSTTTTTTTTTTTATTSSTTTTLTVTTTTTRSASTSVYCFDDTAFSDSNGLGCSDWFGGNCSIIDGLNTEENLAAVRAACPVSCSVCPVDSIIKQTSSVPATTVQTASSVSFEVGLGFDSGNLSDSALIAGLNRAFSTSVGVPLSNVNTELYYADDRRLTGGRAARCAIIVPASSTSLSVVKAATALTADGGSSAEFASFATALSSATGVSTASIAVQKKSACTVGTTSVVVSSDGTVVGKASTSSSTSGGSVALVLESGCEDQNFLDEQGRFCTDWIGYSCFSTKWLAGQRPYTAAGLLEVQENCLLSCGICQPKGRSTAAELKEACEDDEYSTDFCSKWLGLKCDSATDLGYSDDYATDLISLCPFTCGKCLDAEEEEATCNDTANFRDEQNYTCQDWVGLSCTSLYMGYSELGMLDIQSKCRESCGFCNETYAVTKPDVDPETCEDDANFLIAGSFGCDYFIGKSCTYSDIFLEPRWLLGPAAAVEWHEELWSRCPLACGLCDPDDRLSVSGLLLECQDDAYVDSWCASNFEGTDCSDWPSSTQLGTASEAATYNATVFGRCPKSCGLCEEPICEAGTYRSVTEHSCEACEVGTFSTDARSGQEATSCTLARAGFFVNTTGSTEESHCDFGSFSASAGADQCDECPAGQFSASRGSSGCEACAAGYFSTSGSSSCERCPFGTFQGSIGRTSCEACPESFSTLELGSTSNEDCVCAVGYYFEPTLNQCQICPRGFQCFGGAKTVDSSTGMDPTLLLKPGMMSLGSEPLSVYKCIAGETSCPGYRRPGTSADVEEPICQSNSNGVRCGYCNDGFFLDTEEGCLECPNEERLPHVLRMVLVFVVLVATLYHTYVLVAREDFPPKVMAFLIIQFIQGLIAIEGLPIHWPQWMLDIYAWCNYFNIFEVFNNYVAVQEECLFGDTVSSAMTRDMLKPLLPVPLFIPLAIVFRLVVGRHLYIYTVISTVANALSGVFIQISLMVLYAFPTERMPNGKLFLTYYPRIEHGSAEWKTLLPLTAIAVLVYVAGFLSFTAWGIRTLPKLVVQRSELAEMFTFFGDHRPMVYWWIGVVLAYQFFFAFSNAIVDNEFLRVYLTMSFVIAVVMIEISCMPGLTPESQRASVTIQLGLLLLVALGTSMQDFEDVDMEEQKRVVGNITQIVIWTISVIVLARLTYAAWKGRHPDATYVEKRLKILADTRTWMRRTLAEDIKETLASLENLDYCDESLLEEWTIGMRGGVLRMASLSTESTLHNFMGYILSGHRLMHEINHHHSEYTSISGRWREALQIQLKWAREGAADTLGTSVCVTNLEAIEEQEGGPTTPEDTSEMELNEPTPSDHLRI